MDKGNVYETVCKCISSILECEPNELNNASGFLKTYQWDSLAQVEIFCEIEKKYKLNIPNKMISELVTIKDYVNYIEKNIQSNFAGGKYDSDNKV